jgi:hypothetical protein
VSKKTTTSGVGFLGVLQIVLIVLKAFGLIDWPWLLVLFPMWIELAFVAVVLVFYLIICIIVAIVSEFCE